MQPEARSSPCTSRVVAEKDFVLFIVHSLQCVLRLGFCVGECVAISQPLILL